MKCWVGVKFFKITWYEIRIARDFGRIFKIITYKINNSYLYLVSAIKMIFFIMKGT